MKQRVVALLVGILALVAPALVSAQTGTMVTTTGVVYVRSISNVTLTNPTMTTPLVSDNLVLVARTTSGIRLDVSSGVFRVREGDGSADGPMSAGAITSSGDLIVPGPNAYFFSGRGGLTGPADGSIRVRNNANTNTYDITLADWGTTLSAESVSVASDGVLFLGAGRSGYLYVRSDSNRNCAWDLNGSDNQAIEIEDPRGGCSATKDTVGLNTYYDAAGSSGAGYYWQNKSGATRSVRLVLIGS